MAQLQRILWKSCQLLVAFALGFLLFAAPGWADTDYLAGVQAYRQGQYAQAMQIFEDLHWAHPEDSRMTYYLAISEAQLGRYQQARQHYEEILTLDPNSEAARLAQEGLRYLPADTAALDLPPRFQAPPVEGGLAGANSSGNTAGTPGAATMGGMSPQELMMMQMMMGGLGGNGMQGGMNAAMPWMMMPQTGGAEGQQIDPNVMSTFLMNQMMQNFSLDGGSKDDR